MTSSTVYDALIVGGGISGLTAAYRLTTTSPEKSFLLLEGAPRFGGTIYTERIESCILDGGPDSFVAAKPEGRALIEELGLTQHIIAPREDRRAVYLLRKNKLRLLPQGLMLGVPRNLLPFALSPTLPFSMKLLSQIA